MPDSKFVPVVQVADLDQFHFGKALLATSKYSQVFHINRLEDMRPKLIFPIPPHRKGLYDFIFITKGDSLRSKGLNSYHFGKYQFFFLPPLQITSHEHLSLDATGFFVYFAPELFSENVHLLHSFNFLKFNMNPVVTIPVQDLAIFQNIFERLLVINELQDDRHLSTIAWYLLALFSEVNRYTEVSEDLNMDSASTITQQYKNALTQHIYTHRTIKDYASLLHITPNHLNKCVKKTLNKTAQSLLNEMIILEAKSLLRYSDMTVQQIALTLHKSSGSNFSRFFKRETGTSPTTYLAG